RADGLDLDAERLDDGLRRHDGRAPRRGARWAELCLRLRACRAGERRTGDGSGSPSTAPARCQDRYRVPQQRLETASLPLTLVGLEGASYSTTSTPMDARAFTETSARDARASRSRGSDGGAQIRRELDPAASDGREHGLQRRDRAVLVDPAGRALLHADGQHDRRERLRVRAGLQRMLRERDDGEAGVDAAPDRVDQRLDEPLPLAGQVDLAPRGLDTEVAHGALLLRARVVADEPPAGG